MNSSLASDDKARPQPAAPATDTELWHRDSLTQRVFLSPEWKALLGYADHELPGDFNEFQSRLHPDERAGVLRTLHANLARPDFGFDVGFRLRHRDGSYRWIPARGAQAGASGGQPKKPKAAGAPAALRGKAEVRLKAKPASRSAPTKPDLLRLQHELEVHQIELEMQNEELRVAQDQSASDLECYTELYDFAPVGYMSLCAEGTILRLNLLGASLAGMERGRLVGRRFGLFLAEADRQVFSDFLKQVFTSEVKESCEVRLPHEGTVPRVLQIEGTQSQDRQECRAVLLDITERKQAEGALRSIEANLRLSVAASNIGLWDWNLVTNEVYFSKEWKRQIGFAEDEIANRFEEWQSRVHPDDLAPVLAKVHAFIADPEVGYTVEFRLRHKDGSYRWIYTQAQILRDATQKPVRMLGCHIDTTERKQAEAATRASEARYRALVRSATDAIITVDDTGTIGSWNPTAERMFGWAKAEAKGQPLLIIIPERFRAAHLAGLQRVQAGGALRVMAKPVELTGLRQDGQEFPIEMALVRWQHGANSFFGGVIRDVSKRKLAEARLAEERELGEAILNHMPGVFYLITAGGQFLRWNQRFETATGYSAAEIAHMRPADFVCDEHKERTNATFQKVFAEGSASVEADLLTKTGERVPFLFTGAQVVLDGLPCLAGSGVDITERKRTEGSLRLQSAALAAAANEVVITDRHGVIQWVNPAFTKTTGYTLEEAVGQNPRVLKSGKHDLAFYKNLWATIVRGEVWHGEIVNRRKDQSLFTEQATITPVKDERGEVTHFVAIKQDITEKKLLEAKFLRAQRLEGLGALAGGVAHDLNNVLAPILMCAEMLKTRATDENTQALADVIHTSTQRGASMIRQILAFARGTAGDKVPMQVKHLLKDISRMMKDTFPPSIRTELHVDEKLSLVRGEPTELYQLLLNLCVNARDAMPGGGTITLSAQNVRLDETYAHLSHEAPPGNYVVLTVVDTGSGIPPEIRDKIFDAFFTTKAEGKGTGLGLATAKDIVTRHNGFIHLYSEVGVGTQFKIYLPAVAGEEATGDTTLLTLPGGHGELVLVVDDEAAVREIVKATLEANGYRVVLADDGTQAVARFVEHINDVQLLLTDIQMPHMDGMATIRALRNIQPGLRVIAASGLTAHQQALKVTGLNVQGFIAKPFTATSLLLALDAALHPQ